MPATAPVIATACIDRRGNQGGAGGDRRHHQTARANFAGKVEHGKLLVGKIIVTSPDGFTTTH
jgi:hypothetical protein